MAAKFLAFDLGAESGRGVIGTLDGGRLTLKDVHRFGNGPVRIHDRIYWDILRLFAELKRGLGMAVSEHGGDLTAIGIDTWGVDFGLLGRDGSLLANPIHYRDSGNEGMMEEAFALLPRDRIFDRTGIQFMQFNTIFQLLSLKRRNAPSLESARTLLLIPDLLNYWFTGEKLSELSIASTTQFYDPVAGGWATDLLEGLGLPTDILTPIVPTGARIGSVRADIAAETGCGSVPVIAPAEHDTGSAVVAVPASSSDYAYLSSGTWSLMGIETPQPCISDQTRGANFTNEGGACGTTRLLKNIMGLWLVQECRRSWARAGKEYSYPDLAEQAAQAPAFGPIVEPDAHEFIAPADMVSEIARFCRRTGQSAPESVGAVVRCCLESLALKYRWALERLEGFRGGRIETVHIVGGGSQNRLLCQLTADVTRRNVIAGPIEATAIGNVLMQAMGAGMISGLAEAREIVRRSFDLIEYTPAGDAGDWDAAYARFLELRSAVGISN
jgi:rhamnulokinase